jgi:hypothetical protein
LADRHARIERRERILEDHLHARTQRRHFDARTAVDRLPVGIDLAAVGVVQPQKRLAQRCLARTGLADDSKRFVAAKGQIEAVDRNKLLQLRLEEGAMAQHEGDTPLLTSIGIPGPISSVAVESRKPTSGSLERRGELVRMPILLVMRAVLP